MRISFKITDTRRLIFLCLAPLFLLTLFIGFKASAQQNDNSNSNSNTSTSTDPTPTPTPAPTPIPVSFIISEKENTEKRLREIEQSISDQPSVQDVQNSLSSIEEDLRARERRTGELLDTRPSLDVLDKLEFEWNQAAPNLTSQKERLQVEAAQISEQLAELENLLAVWELTRRRITEGVPPPVNVNTAAGQPAVAGSPAVNRPAANLPAANEQIAAAEVNAADRSAAPAVNVPEDIKQSVNETIEKIKNTQIKVGEYLSGLLRAQEKISETDKRIDKILDKIAATRKDLLSNLIVKDSPPIWQTGAQQTALGRQIQNSFSEKLGQLRVYFSQHQGLFLFHALLILGLILAFHRARRKTHQLVEEEPRLRQGLIIFEHPLASALILGLFIGPLLYPQAPDLLGVIVSPFLIIAIFFLIRQLIDKEYLPILIGIVVLYLVNDLRLLFASAPFLSRVLFLTEMLGGIIFLIWLIRAKSRPEKPADPESSSDRYIKNIGIFMLVPFILAFLTNALGYVALSGVIGRAIVSSSVLGLVFYALVRVADSLLVFVFRISPVSKLMMVNRHRILIQNKIFRIIKWLAVAIWFLVVLNLLYILRPVYNSLGNILNAELKIGTISLTLGGVILLVITIWLSFLLSRFIRFALEEDVYTRVRLADGLPYAVSTILHYLILFFGFLLAIAAMGINLTNFTVLLGAFGVGLGFGLQNIIENFTSGLILLFERPVKVGDSIQMNEHQGHLRRIGLRASIVRTFDGAEIIVPNGQLITQEVTNWTLSDPRRRIDIDVGVDYGTDPETVISLLEEIGKNHPDSDDELAPRALFTAFGDNSLNFQLRVWTAEQDRWVIIKSELSVGVYKTLTEAGIGIPFPQRDLHLKSIDNEVLSKIKPASK